MNEYKVTFEFIENGHTCHTSWTATADSKADAVRKAREWFGFDKDGIEVTDTEVEELD